MVGSKDNVYIIDDDAELRVSLTYVLMREGRTIEGFASAEEFLEGAREAHPSCVILDLRLPQMSGMELLQELRRRGMRWPVIVMTGQGDVETAVRAMQLGAVNFCLKPADPAELTRQVAQVLANEATMVLRWRRMRDAQQRLANLTHRERELFELVVVGKTNKEMAAVLGISPRTVEQHRANIFTKLGAGSVAELVRLGLFAKEENLAVGTREFGEIQNCVA
jgi:two-component system, LuxR family, response regulator FixJ